MITRSTLPAVFAALSLCVAAQPYALNTPTNIVLPKDSVVAKQLMSSLNGFLSQKEKPNSENTFVLPEDLLATSVLLDEIKGIEANRKLKDTNFYKGYLTNVSKLDDTNYLIQFSYIGLNESTPMLRASFALTAKPKDGKFYFASPLKQNTQLWKSKTIGSVTFHYKHELNTGLATAYAKKKDEFTARLKAKPEHMEFYICDNLREILQTLGVDYKAAYNSYRIIALSGLENNEYMLLAGTDEASFDPHDLWHSRLHTVLSSSIINRPVDEGCAYLYGGSWGITWPQIMKQFKEKVASDPKADWLALYEASQNFSDDKQKELIVGYVINALLVEKIEKEKGWPAVIELLSCGKYEKGNENYFKALGKVSGITKQNFNEQVWLLVKNSK